MTSFCKGVYREPATELSQGVCEEETTNFTSSCTVHDVWVFYTFAVHMQASSVVVRTPYVQCCQEYIFTLCLLRGQKVYEKCME